MARPRMTDAQREARALQAGQRAIARGERPLYRLRIAQDGAWTVEWCPWLSGTASGRRDALAAARGIVAAWLGCDETKFTVESL